MKQIVTKYVPLLFMAVEELRKLELENDKAETNKQNYKQ